MRLFTINSRIKPIIQKKTIVLNPLKIKGFRNTVIGSNPLVAPKKEHLLVFIFYAFIYGKFFEIKSLFLNAY